MARPRGRPRTKPLTTLTPKKEKEPNVVIDGIPMYMYLEQRRGSLYYYARYRDEYGHRHTLYIGPRDPSRKEA